MSRKKDERPPIQMMAMAELVPMVPNPRINAHAVEQVAWSIERFGFADPLVVTGRGLFEKDRFTIIAGHTRFKAATKMGMEIVPVRVMWDINQHDARVLNVADNKLGELAKWDYEPLGVFLKSVRETAPDDLKYMGFASGELDTILAARFNPGEKSDLDAALGESKSPSHNIFVSAEQWKVIKAALQKLCDRESDQNIRDGRALEMICAEWMG